MSQIVFITVVPSGIGEAVALRHAEYKPHLMITGRPHDRLSQLQNKQEEKNVRVLTLCFDARDEITEKMRSETCRKIEPNSIEPNRTLLYRIT